MCAVLKNPVSIRNIIAEEIRAIYYDRNWFVVNGYQHTHADIAREMGFSLGLLRGDMCVISIFPSAGQVLVHAGNLPERKPKFLKEFL